MAQISTIKKSRVDLAGFSLLELMVALAIAALLVGLTVPATARLYEAMQYRSAVGDVVAGLATARQKAIQSGQPVDFELEPGEGRFRVDKQKWKRLPEGMTLGAVVAQELSSDPKHGIIRFYSDGSASGGTIDLERASGAGVRLEVDWLLGRIKQYSLGEDGI